MSSDPNKTVKVVFACLDWRLHPAIENYFTQDGTGCDMCITAGSLKDMIDPQTQALFVKQVEISKELHNCRAVILTMHLDCGAYGGSKAFADAASEMAACRQQLELGKAVIEKNFPGLPVESYIIGLEHANGAWNILPQKITI
jgi:hypothetical protein